MSRLKIVKEQADESTYQDWREEDYMNKMNFNPLVMFVVIPTVVQAACLVFMGGAMLLNTCLLYTSPSPRDMRRSRMPSSA